MKDRKYLSRHSDKIFSQKNDASGLVCIVCGGELSEKTVGLPKYQSFAGCRARHCLRCGKLYDVEDNKEVVISGREAFVQKNEEGGVLCITTFS